MKRWLDSWSVNEDEPTWPQAIVAGLLLLLTGALSDDDYRRIQDARSRNLRTTIRPGRAHYAETATYLGLIVVAVVILVVCLWLLFPLVER